MTADDRLRLASERTALERMIAETPLDEVIDRASLQARLEEVVAELAVLPAPVREPARVRLTFRGKPVVGRHGIFAEFGLAAVNGFTNAVAAMASSLSGPLAQTGPIPGRDQHQLLITRTALGSFGFELEEHRPGQLELEELSPVARALEKTHRLLRATLGTDDELADSAEEVDQRALQQVRSFLATLADHEATCAVRYGDLDARFDDLSQVRRGLERLSQANLREAELVLAGAFQGVLPKSRTFEFVPADGGPLVKGRIGPGVAAPARLNQLLDRHVSIKVMATTVGNGRPRYVLLEMPDVAVDESFQRDGPG